MTDTIHADPAALLGIVNDLRERVAAQEQRLAVLESAVCYKCVHCRTRAARWGGDKCILCAPPPPEQQP